MKTLRVSKKFKEAILLDPRKSYEIASEAGIHPSTLSHIVIGYSSVREGDPRVLAVARVLNLAPEKCFEEVEN